MYYFITVSRVDYALDLFLICSHIWARLTWHMNCITFYSFIIKNLCNSHQLMLTQNTFKINMFQVTMKLRLELAWGFILKFIWSFRSYCLMLCIWILRLYFTFWILCLNKLFKIYIIPCATENNHQYVAPRCFRHRLGCYRLVSEPWL